LVTGKNYDFYEMLETTSRILLNTAEGKTIGFVGGVSGSCLLFVFAVIAATKSIALQAFVILTVFDVLSLCTALYSHWAAAQNVAGHITGFSYGYERGEVLAVFSSTVLTQLGALFILKESIERLLEHGDDAPGSGWFLIASTAIFASHLLVLYGVRNRPLTVVVTSSGSSWLQEHAADLSHAVCRIVPGLSRFLLPRANPFALFGVFGYVLCLITYLLVETYQCYACDTLVALCIAVITIGTMFPLASYTGRILLQTSPTHVLPQLDKCLREAGTLDGVLEIADDRFWQVSFTKMAGSVVVRVRRDADEQLVLAHVTDRLFPIVPELTVQVNKDTSWRPALH